MPFWPLVKIIIKYDTPANRSLTQDSQRWQVIFDCMRPFQRRFRNQPDFDRKHHWLHRLPPCKYLSMSACYLLKRCSKSSLPHWQLHKLQWHCPCDDRRCCCTRTESTSIAVLCYKQRRMRFVCLQHDIRDLDKHLHIGHYFRMVHSSLHEHGLRLPSQWE